VSPFEANEFGTPLEAGERADLLPTHVTVRSELNELEADNIIDAEQWAFRRRRVILSERFLLQLHQRMFGRVWAWAGAYRKTQRNLGVDWRNIQTGVHDLLADAEYWIEHSTYSRDECVIRFHHRLVVIHPFVNGNGRHSRLMADLIAHQLGEPRFSWGGRENRGATGELRETYIRALQSADRQDYAPLLAFARS